jgi:hypothetical protein
MSNGKAFLLKLKKELETTIETNSVEDLCENDEVYEQDDNDDDEYYDDTWDDIYDEIDWQTKKAKIRRHEKRNSKIDL